MSCKKYFGVVKTSAPVVSGNNLVIELPNFCHSINNGDYVDVVTCCNFDYPECIGNVIFVANGVSFIAIKVGVVKSDQYYKRTKYRLVFGTEFNTVTICNSLCDSKYPFPSVDVPTVIYSTSQASHKWVEAISVKASK